MSNNENTTASPDSPSYKILIDSSPHGLAESVTAAMREGYYPIGSPVVDRRAANDITGYGGGVTYLQSVVREYDH